MIVSPIKTKTSHSCQSGGITVREIINLDILEEALDDFLRIQHYVTGTTVQLIFTNPFLNNPVEEQKQQSATKQA